MKKSLLSLLLCTMLMAGCVGVTPIAETPTSTVAPTPTELPIPEVESIHPGLEIISPENVDRLEELGKWGESIVYDIAIAPDRKTIAARTVDGIHFYDSQTLEEVNYIEANSDYTADRYFSVSYSPDGKYLAASGNYAVSIINLATGEREKRISSRLPGDLDDTHISDVEISPDNRHAVVVSQTLSAYCDGAGKNLALYDITAERGKLLFDRYVCAPDISRFRFTTGNHLYFFLWSALNLYPYQMDIVDLGTGRLTKNVSFDDNTDDPLRTVYDISPDEKVFASIELKDSGQVTNLIDARTGNVLQTIEEPFITFVSAQDGAYTWLQMGKSPLNSDISSCVVLPNSGMQYEEIFTEKDTVSLLVKNGRFLAIELWNINDCELSKRVSFAQYYSGMGKFSPGGTLFAIPSGDGVEMWDTTTNQLQFAGHSTSSKLSIDAYTFNKDGSRLIIGATQQGNQGGQKYMFHSLEVWDTQAGSLITTIKTWFSPTSLVSTPDPDIVAAVNTNMLTFWNIETGKKISSFPAANFVVSPEGDSVWILLQGARNTITLFDLSTGKPLKSISISDAIQSVYGFYVDTKGESCAVFYINGDTTYLKRIDLQTGKELFKVPLENRTYGFIDQGNSFLTYDYVTKNVDLWNFQSNLPIQSIYGTFGRDLTISPDNRILASVYSLSYLRTRLGIWDIQSGKLITEVSTPFKITDVQFSPDGQLIVMGGTDGFIHVWGVRKP
ncbi:MAG: hypothetical protein HY869_18175 [Chloroflexi bacterium]|nr:hypothetical protein [Chloroflexota bacterium]